MAALFTGRLPSSGGSIGLLEAQPAESSITLASAFRRAGYRTALATNQPLLSGRGFTRGFDDVAVTSAQESWPCAEVVRRGLAAFDAPDGGPRFLYLQLVEPHQPHTPSEDALRRFAEAGTDDLVARYDAEVAAADECLGAAVEGLRSRGVLDDSVLVVLGTQGEELGEHGDTGSGWTVYDEVLRVPLVVRAPGLLEPARSDAPASLVDLYPTLLALHSLPAAAEDAFLDGRSLLAERGARFRSIDADDRAVIAELVIPERAIARAVIQGGAKYVATSRATHRRARRDRRGLLRHRGGGGEGRERGPAAVGRAGDRGALRSGGGSRREREPRGGGRRRLRTLVSSRCVTSSPGTASVAASMASPRARRGRARHCRPRRRSRN